METSMTAQFGEKLIIDGESNSMMTQPLAVYFELSGVQPEFEVSNTALWRGYVGTWELVDERLYILKISANYTNGVSAKLEDFFPGYPDRVFAHWYSGTIRIPQGEIVKYVHMGHESVFEQDLILRLEKGYVVSREIIDNNYGLMVETNHVNDCVSLSHCRVCYNAIGLGISCLSNSRRAFRWA